MSGSSIRPRSDSLVGLLITNSIDFLKLGIGGTYAAATLNLADILVVPSLLFTPLLDMLLTE